MKINITSLELSNFGYIIATADILDKHDRSAPSHYHWKILKCRMILFSHTSILASPDKKDLQQVHIVIRKSGDDYDKLNSLFMKFSLSQKGGIRTTTPEIFQMCFHYTMTARIAPVWNTLGENYLINDRNFLTTKGPLEGICYNVNVDENRTLSLEISSVKINLMTTEEVFFPGEWIRVLPSLNKAMIEVYYETFPQVGKFRCYKDLRRHWKNIHGYRLPEEEGSHYSIQFWRGEPLLYPKICVVRNMPIITPTPKSVEKTIIQRFLNSLNAKMPNMLDAVSMRIQIQFNQNIEDETGTLHVSRHGFPETQVVSLCTPTQSTTHFRGSR